MLEMGAQALLEEERQEAPEGEALARELHL